MKLRDTVGLFLVLVWMVFPAVQAASVDPEIDAVRGLVKPQNRAVLSSEIPAKVLAIPFKDGAEFKKGETLIQFECSVFEAELAAAQAEYDVRQSKHENLVELLSLNATSDMEVELAKAELTKAGSQRQIAMIRVDRCTVKAPYNGRVLEVSTNEFESVNVNTDLIAILNNGQLEIELIVPSNWLAHLEIGQLFKFHVDETDQQYTAKISRLGAAVDPVSQTIRIVGMFVEADDNILSGMSGSAFFSSPN
jgi:RND family efflux transporter MFP subunit